MEILVIIAVFWVVGKILKGLWDSGSLITGETDNPLARQTCRTHAGHRQDIHSY